MMSGYNVFDDFDFMTWASQDFLEHNGLFTYEDALTQFENLHSVEASFALCWQPLDSLFFWMDSDELRTIRKEVLKELNSTNMWRGSFPGQFRAAVVREMWDEIEFEPDEGCEQDDADYPDEDGGGHPNEADYEFIKEEYEINARQRRGEYLNRLSALVSLAKPNTEPDEYILDKEAIIYAHLSVGLALLLEEVEEGQSERYWELLESASRVIKTPKTESISPWQESSGFSEIIEKSTAFLEVLIECKLFYRDFYNFKYIRALDRLNDAFRLAVAETFDAPFEDSYPSDECYDVFVWMQEFQGGIHPLINASDAGCHLVANLINPQKAVDAFENLWEENPSDTRWRSLSDYCLSFTGIWIFGQTERDDGEPLVLPKSFPGYLPPSTFWNHANMLTLQRISPSELMEYQAQIRERESETRLRLYFFGKTWDSLPAKARAALISADREFENPRGRRPIIFDHLRHAARATMVESLWKPYREFLRGKAAGGLKDISDLLQVRQIIEDDQSEPDLAPLVKSPYFDEFLATFIEDTKFVRTLPKKLLDLNDWANKVSHEHHWGYKGFESQIRETYAEFLGIGRNGILPRLMRLHPKAKPNSGK